MLRQNIQERIKKTLKDSLGFKTGLVETDFTASSIYLYKNDGTSSTIVLNLGVNFFEVDPVLSPGLYEFVIPNTDLDQIGQVSISFSPSAAAFIQDYFIETVSKIEESTAQIALDTAAIVALLPATTIAAYTDVLLSETNIRGVDNRDLSVIAGAGFAPTDSLVAIKSAISSSPASVWEELLASHNNLNTFGELLNILYAVLLNRIKIDTTLNKMFLYKADNTLLKSYDLFNPSGFPSGVNVTERAKAV